MKKARLKDGQVVLAHQYNQQAHGTDLHCADPECGAVMIFRKESLTHGAAALRSAAFVSRAIKDHKAGCTAHEDFRIMARQKKSIEQAIAEGKSIILNLNINLTGTFNNVARDPVCKASTHEKGSYVTASAKSVEDILDLMKTIEEKGGPAAIAKTSVNYKGKTMPVAHFVIDTKEKYRDLVANLYAKWDRGGPDAELADFPRLIAFRATQNTKSRDKGPLRGTPVPLTRNGRGNMLLLLQRALVPPEFDNTLRGESVRLIAIPSLDYAEAKQAMDQMQSETRKTVYLNLRWKVVGANQFTPMDEPAPAGKPRPQQQNLFGI